MVELKIVSNEKELLQCLIIRGIVFVEEQNVPYGLECDDYDQLGRDDAIHILGTEDQEPIATGRIIFKTASSVKLERIAVRQGMRGKGIGKQIVALMIAESRQRGAKKIYMNAQLYLQTFYQDLGFVAQGEIFEEAGIEHVYMEYAS